MQNLSSKLSLLVALVLSILSAAFLRMKERGKIEIRKVLMEQATTSLFKVRVSILMANASMGSLDASRRFIGKAAPRCVPVLLLGDTNSVHLIESVMAFAKTFIIYSVLIVISYDRGCH